MFGAADYAVFGAMLLVSSAIGLYYRFTGGRQKTSAEYVLGDRSMSVLPVAFSLMASFMSAITLLGVTRENYSFGTQFVAINAAYGVGTLFSAYLFLPVFFRLQEQSAYAYLERRFGYQARLLASLSFSLQMILYMGIVLHAPALALSAVTGLSYLGSILAVGVACTFYSTLGGIKAVLITDVFQSLLMFSAIFAVIILGAGKVGGLAEVLSVARERDRLQLFNFEPDPTVRHTFWTQVVGGIFVYCSIYGVNQAQVQRLLTVGSLRKSQLALWLQWPILTFLSLSTSLAGLTVFAYYRDCDPVEEGRISKGDQILPLFVVDTMQSIPGLSGLFVAGIFSGSLSTVSSAINSLAAVTVEDYVKPFYAGAANSALLLKVLAFTYGVLCVGLAFLADYMGPGVLQASLTIFGVVGGPLLGLFTLGMAFPRANQVGSLIGTTVSLAFLFWIGFGQPKPPVVPLPLSVSGCGNATSAAPMTSMPTTTPLSVEDDISSVAEDEASYFYLYRISYAWYATLGFFMTVTLGFAASLVSQCLMGGDQQQLEPSLFMPLVPRTWIVKGGVNANDVELDAGRKQMRMPSAEKEEKC